MFGFYHYKPLSVINILHYTIIKYWICKYLFFENNSIANAQN